MKKFEITEVDNDYRTWTDSFIKEFPSLKDAEKYCEEQSWTGYMYFISREIKDDKAKN